VRNPLLAVVLLLSAAAAAARDYAVGPAPSWVLPANAHARPAPASEVSAGAYWRVVDYQVRVDDNTTEEYHRFAIELLNERGVEDNAQIALDFDPTYQSLTVHQVSIRRGATRADALGNARASVLQREKDLENRIYDGSKTLNLVLADVRVGDVLEYSYSLRGRNPVFGTRYYDSFRMGWADPVAFLRLRVLHPPGRDIRYKVHAGIAQPVRRDQGDQREMLWEMADVPGRINEDDRPGWHVLYPYIQLSEARNWNEVGRWAHALFQAYAPGGEKLLARSGLAQARKLPAGERILRALRFVQQQIRYTGIAIGPGSHQPADPGVVLERRFGDCKDKSLLLVQLLRALDIEADTALVNNYRGMSLDALLPSPLAFNHAIVRARVDGRDYWLDPTMAPQGGGLDDVYQPDYGFALLVAADTTELLRMPRARAAAPLQDVHDVFDLRAGVGKPGTLTVTSRYLGREADRMRARFAGSSRAQIESDYLNFYARDYSVEAIGRIEVRDDLPANRLQVIERYRLATAFQDATEGGKELHVRGYSLDEFVRKPDTLVRQSPLAISHPVNVRHVIEVRLPEAWNLEDESAEILDPAFEFRASRHYDAREEVLRLEYSYRSLADHVAPQALGAYLAKLDTVDEEYGYWFSYGADSADGTGYVPAFYIVGLLALAAGLWLARGMYRYSPPALQPPTAETRRGIHGWLLLPALGCVFGPPVALYMVWTLSGHFGTDVWGGTYAVLSPVLRSIAHPYLVACFALAVVFACAEGALTLLFFKRRTSVPRLFPAMCWVSVGLVVLISFGFDSARDEESLATSLSEVARSIFTAAIWTAYFRRSRRVRSTFVETLPEPTALGAPAPPTYAVSVAARSPGAAGPAMATDPPPA